MYDQPKTFYKSYHRQVGKIYRLLVESFSGGTATEVKKTTMDDGMTETFRLMAWLE